MNVYRKQQHLILAYTAKRDKQGQPLCQLCGVRLATQVHEIIARNMTMGNYKARRLSYTYTLCSYLCERCHTTAPMRKIEVKLWAYNFKAYGEQLVRRDIARVEAALGFTLTLALPERNTMEGFASKLSDSQIRLARLIQNNGITSFSQAVKALENDDTERIAGWKAELKQLEDEGNSSESTLDG